MPPRLESLGIIRGPIQGSPETSRNISATWYRGGWRRPSIGRILCRETPVSRTAGAGFPPVYGVVTLLKILPKITKTWDKSVTMSVIVSAIKFTVICTVTYIFSREQTNTEITIFRVKCNKKCNKIKLLHFRVKWNKIKWIISYVLQKWHNLYLFILFL